MIERYSFVAITTLDLERARRFWVDVLEFPITEEERDRFFILDLGGLRGCIDAVTDGDNRSGPTSSLAIRLKVKSVSEVLSKLTRKDLAPQRGPVVAKGAQYVKVLDPRRQQHHFTEVD